MAEPLGLPPQITSGRCRSANERENPQLSQSLALEPSSSVYRHPRISKLKVMPLNMSSSSKGLLVPPSCLGCFKIIPSKLRNLDYFPIGQCLG